MPKQLEAYEIIHDLETNLPDDRKQILHRYTLGVLSEVNYLLNEIFWSFFDSGKRRRQFIETLQESEQPITNNMGFWLHKGKHSMIKKPLDCLGKRNFLRCLMIYFEKHPDKQQYFNEHLRMRFLIFYADEAHFLDIAVTRLCTLRNYLEHPQTQYESKKIWQQALPPLCYLVHPVFFNLFKDKVRSLAKGLEFAIQVNEAFNKLQEKRKEQIRRQRRDHFSTDNTRREKGRAHTRAWYQFRERHKLRRRQWCSEYQLQNFIYQYQRIDPENIKKFATGIAPAHTPLFKDVEDIHILLSKLDLLLWQYLPTETKDNKEANELRNCLAHNEKVVSSKNRHLKKEFATILNSQTNAVSANNFYIQASTILQQCNHRKDQETNKKVYYQKNKETEQLGYYRKDQETGKLCKYDKGALRDPKSLRRAASYIKRQLDQAWGEYKNKKTKLEKENV